MPSQIKSKKIGEKEIACTQWPAGIQVLNQLKLAQLFGPALMDIAKFGQDLNSGKLENDKLVEVGASALQSFIKVLFSTSSPEAVMSTIKELLVGLRVRNIDGSGAQEVTTDNFDVVFADCEGMFIYQCFFFIVQSNYGNFIPGHLIEKVKAKSVALFQSLEESQEKPQNTSNVISQG